MAPSRRSNLTAEFAADAGVLRLAGSYSTWRSREIREEKNDVDLAVRVP